MDQSFYGITLVKRPSGEADSVVAIYTKEFGLIKALATGSKKITSKLSSHLEPMLLIHGRLVEKKRPRITDALVMHSFSGIRSTPKLFDEMLELMQFVEVNTAENQPDEAMWNALSEILASAETAHGQSHERHSELCSAAYDNINRVLGYA